jgi:EmrB/QacA subfamily drug resistance transporter
MAHRTASSTRGGQRGPHPSGFDPRRWWALVLLCLAQFMVILDITVVNVALPTIGADLGLDRASLTWVVTTYTLCLGGLLLLGGRLADTLGRRRMFLAGLGLFTIASLASGLAQIGPVLVAARAGQGIGAALLSPAALAIITTTFHGQERNRALGVWAAIAGAGAAVGVLAGGLLVQYASWRWVFFLNLPVGILVAAATPVVVPAARPGQPTRQIDLPGALAGTLATAAVIYGLVKAGSDGWDAATTLVPLAAGLMLAGGFVAIERVASQPLVPLPMLTRRPLLAGQVVMFATSGLLLAIYFLSSLYLQRGLGYTALDTGLVFLPAALVTIASSHLGARAGGRLGLRPVAAVGFGLTATGALLLSRLPTHAAVLIDLLPGLLLATAGLGAGFVVATTAAMAHVDRAQAGLASGLLSTGHELGASLGVAMVSSVAGASISGGPLHGRPPVGGFDRAFLVCAVVAALAALAVPWLLPPGRPPATDRPAFAH